jgi:hypothetical protein
MDDNTEHLIESVRAALTVDAAPETHAAGVAACRTILEALDSRNVAAAPSPPPVAAQLVPTLAALRGMPLDQALDSVIGLLRARLPAGPAPLPVLRQAPRIVMVPLPGLPGGGR